MSIALRLRLTFATFLMRRINLAPITSRVMCVSTNFAVNISCPPRKKLVASYYTENSINLHSSFSEIILAQSVFGLDHFTVFREHFILGKNSLSLNLSLVAAEFQSVLRPHEREYLLVIMMCCVFSYGKAYINGDYVAKQNSYKFLNLQLNKILFISDPSIYLQNKFNFSSKINIIYIHLTY